MEESEIDWDNIQITFLEKFEGEWKISFVTWLPKFDSGKEIIQSNSTLSKWNFTLKPDVNEADMEAFLLEEFIPTFEENYTGISLFLLKQDRGTDDDSYSIMLLFGSIEARDAWWPKEGEPSDMAKEAGNKMEGTYDKLWTFIEMDSWNDWLVMK